MRIELTATEVRTVIEVLDDRLRGLRAEIVHTSTHDYKDILRQRERILQCLHDKLVTQDALNVA